MNDICLKFEKVTYTEKSVKTRNKIFSVVSEFCISRKPDCNNPAKDFLDNSFCSVHLFRS